MSVNTESYFTNGPISMDRMIQMLTELKRGQQTGAVEVFMGQVRADQLPGGKRITHLDYTCYEKMAAAKMEAVCREAMDAFPVQKIAVKHSLGQVPVGDICFLVAAAAGHRQEAREATALVVDQVKSQVPIYAREVVQDGDYQWKVNH